MRRSIVVFVLCGVALAACKKRPELLPVTAEGFNLGAAASVIQDNKAKTGKDFERAINARSINKLDLDGDRKIDPIQVVEERDGDRRTLTLRAVPTAVGKGQKPEDIAVPVAIFDITPDRDNNQIKVEGRYATKVVGGPPVAFAAPAAWQGGVLVVPQTSFFYWLLIIERPVFVGVYYLDVIVVDRPHYHFKHKHK